MQIISPPDKTAIHNSLAIINPHLQVHERVATNPSPPPKPARAPGPTRSRDREPAKVQPSSDPQSKIQNLKSKIQNPATALLALKPTQEIRTMRKMDWALTMQRFLGIGVTVARLTLNQLV
jgi:hypothetical protein